MAGISAAAWTAIAAATGAGAAIAGTAYQLSQGKPKQPSALQPTKDPNIDVFRRQNQSNMAPGAALAGNSSTALTGGAGTGNIGTSTLLGQ